MIYKINSADNLWYARKYYHDAVFLTDKISFDSEKKIFLLSIYRPLLEEIVLKKSFSFIKIWLLPRMESQLVFNQVNGIDVKPKYQRDIIIAIDYNPKHHCIKFNCANDSVIILHVAELNGVITDIGQKIFDNSKIFSLFGIKIRWGF